VQVRLTLDLAAVEDLELLVRYRHGVTSRSAIVREAIDWLRSKEAAWLIRARRAEAQRLERRTELDRARSLPREERDRLDAQAQLDEALRIARGD
jgi:hypothetical protein